MGGNNGQVWKQTPPWLGEYNYPPGSVIKLLGAAALPGGLQHSQEGCDPSGRVAAFQGV